MISNDSFVFERYVYNWDIAVDPLCWIVNVYVIISKLNNNVVAIMLDKIGLWFREYLYARVIKIIANGNTGKICLLL